MNNLDFTFSIEPKASLNKSTHRQPSDSRFESATDRGRPDEEGLNFSQILIDNKERVEKTMNASNARGENKVTTEEPKAEGKDQAAPADTPANLSHSDKAMTQSTTNTTPPDNSMVQSDKSMTLPVKAPLPAIIAQGLAVQAQVTNPTLLSQGSSTGPSYQTPGEQTVASIVATIEEASIEGMKPATTGPGAKGLNIAPEVTPPNASEVTTTGKPPMPADTVAAATLKESESVIQGLVDEDAESDLTANAKKSPKAANSLVNKNETYSAMAAMKRPAAGNPIVSEGQLLSDSAGDELSLAGEMSNSGEDDSAQNQTPTNEPQPDVALASESVPAPASSEGIPLEQVELTAHAPEPPVRAPMMSTSDQPLDLKAARQVRAQVISQVGFRVPNVTGQERLTVNLNPESLGQVEVTFEPKGDRLLVSIVASNAAAAVALQDDVQDLTDRIAERSGRFNQVEIKIEVKDGADARSDNKENDKNEERQGQKRDQIGRASCRERV